MTAFIILLVFEMIFWLLMMIKAKVTQENHFILIDAISKYRISLINQHLYEPEVDYKDKESFEKTLFRLWDWGYKRILPKEKFEIIEPFIEEAKKK